MIVVHCIEKLTICIRFYLRTTVPSGWRSHSSNAYMYGSVVLPTLPNPCELIADAFGLPADLRRYSVGASSLINDARESFSEKKNKSKQKTSDIERKLWSQKAHSRHKILQKRWLKWEFYFELLEMSIVDAQKKHSLIDREKQILNYKRNTKNWIKLNLIILVNLLGSDVYCLF